MISNISKWYALGVACAAFSVCFVVVDTHAAEGVNRSIRVRGEGSVTSPPDIATVVLGVESKAKTAADALQANNSDMQALMDKLTTLGIAAKDIQTSQFHLAPVYQPRARSVIDGYQVTNQVRVRTRNLPELGTLLDAVVNAGGNSISGIQFDIDDPRGIMDQARNRAWQDARHRAELYASAAGGTLGPVLTIEESSATSPGPFMMRGMAEMAAGSVPVAAGEQTLSATVEVQFEFVPKP